LQEYLSFIECFAFETLFLNHDLHMGFSELHFVTRYFCEVI